MDDEQLSSTEIKKLAMRKYQQEFYERNKERIREDKLLAYYKKEYGLEFLTKEQLKSFKDHKPVYLALMDANNVLNKDIIRGIINMKYA